MTAPDGVPFFSRRIKRLGELMMHHQCWFFGRDIFHPDGNLLIRYGFERLKAPNRKVGTNRYRIANEGAYEMNLWGFGMFYGARNTGGVFIRRYDFTPRLSDRGSLDSRVFRSEQLPANRLPSTNAEIGQALRLTREAIDWIIDYENWVESECGKTWRGRCLREWTNSEIAARHVKTNWLKLAKQIDRLNN